MFISGVSANAAAQGIRLLARSPGRALRLLRCDQAECFEKWAEPFLFYGKAGFIL